MSEEASPSVLSQELTTTPAPAAQAPSKKDCKVLFVGNIPASSTEASIQDEFKQFGQISRVWVPTRSDLASNTDYTQLTPEAAATGEFTRCPEALGYAYVFFVRPEDAARAKKEAAATSGNFGKLANARVDFYVGEEGDKFLSRVLFVDRVKGVPEEELQKKFEQYGAVEQCRIMLNGRGESRGFGFIVMSEAVAAEQARTMLYDFPIRAGTNNRLKISYSCNSSVPSTNTGLPMKFRESSNKSKQFRGRDTDAPEYEFPTQRYSFPPYNGSPYPNYPPPGPYGPYGGPQGGYRGGEDDRRGGRGRGNTGGYTSYGPPEKRARY